MARSAGMSAWLMLVPDRSEAWFSPDLLTFHQFETEVAIVSVEGKEQFFDPGSRYSRYGHLAWWHTDVQGLRQTADGTTFAKTPSEDAAENTTVRIATLTMNEKGEVTGKISMTYQGAAALHWRHVSLSGDAEGLSHALQTSMEELLPKTSEVKVAAIHGLEDYEKPLTVSFEVSGPLGVAAGSRMTVLADALRSNVEASFPQAKRELPVSFRYPQRIKDEVQMEFPARMKVESLPSETKLEMPGVARYALAVTSSGAKFVAQRTSESSAILVPLADFEKLRSFTTQYEEKDHESVVLKTGS